MQKSEYYSLFEGLEEKALERAWLNRDFEIERYWQRASYFWAFTAAAFAGFFALAASSTIEIRFPQLQFFVICLGLIFSVGWLLVNIGSKKWQKNWEKHIDMLEDIVTGPIYKTVLEKKSFSVSNINIIVNSAVIAIWALLFFDFLFVKMSFKCDSHCKPDLLIIIACLITFICLALMVWGPGKTGSIRKPFSFVKREISYKN
ncbi:RipA family octameric membrane protein [Chitinophaga arvensicola]|uniref:Uncharacterized protein n=1 Tax=Chitinophaga arvensicola TaxID=29529 RepID=A0A1I0SDQ1_9BACT|nr:hypothetical protein [Chitinophaga arvensicola]SEW56411.1 hypothetical protein SAMN04488122_6659 [Chitinophaga arvensicola]